MKKQSLAARVLVFLKGGDEAKLARFEGKVEKYFEKQVKSRQEKISTLQDKLVDATEELNDAVLNVDVERINKTESTEDYCVKYVTAVKAKADALDNYNEQIKTLEEEIEALNDLNGVIFSTKEG